MPKHTQGPWRVDRVGDNIEIRPVHPTHGCTLGFAPIARIIGDKRVTDDETDEANSRLVASAPRMSEALKRAARILAELPDSEQTQQMKALRKEIVATIKEATPEYYGG